MNNDVMQLMDIKYIHALKIPKLPRKLKGVDVPFTWDKKGRVTTVASQDAPKGLQIRPSGDSNTLIGADIVTQHSTKVLQDNWSDGDLMIHENGRPMHFLYLTRQVSIYQRFQMETSQAREGVKSVWISYNTQSAQSI